MRNVLAIAGAMLMAFPAAAHERVVRHDPTVAQVVHLGTAPTPGNGRIRIVYHGRTGAMLTLEQFWDYQRAYDHALARYAMHQPIHRAHSSARHAAWHAVVHNPRRVEAIAIFPVPK